MTKTFFKILYVLSALLMAACSDVSDSKRIVVYDADGNALQANLSNDTDGVLVSEFGPVYGKNDAYFLPKNQIRPNSVLRYFVDGKPMALLKLDSSAVSEEMHLYKNSEITETYSLRLCDTLHSNSGAVRVHIPFFDLDYRNLNVVTDKGWVAQKIVLKKTEIDPRNMGGVIPGGGLIGDVSCTAVSFRVNITDGNFSSLETKQAGHFAVSFQTPDKPYFANVDTIPMWLFNETSCEWTNDTFAVRVGDHFETGLKKFGWWTAFKPNCRFDRVVVQLFDKDKPVPYADILLMSPAIEKPYNFSTPYDGVAHLYFNSGLEYKLVCRGVSLKVYSKEYPFAGSFIYAKEQDTYGSRGRTVANMYMNSQGNLRSNFGLKNTIEAFNPTRYDDLYRKKYVVSVEDKYTPGSSFSLASSKISIVPMGGRFIICPKLTSLTRICGIGACDSVTNLVVNTGGVFFCTADKKYTVNLYTNRNTRFDIDTLETYSGKPCYNIKSLSVPIGFDTKVWGRINEYGYSFSFEDNVYTPPSIDLFFEDKVYSPSPICCQIEYGNFSGYQCRESLCKPVSKKEVSGSYPVKVKMFDAERNYVILSIKDKYANPVAIDILNDNINPAALLYGQLSFDVYSKSVGFFNETVNFEPFTPSCFKPYSAYLFFSICALLFILLSVGVFIFFKNGTNQNRRLTRVIAAVAKLGPEYSYKQKEKIWDFRHGVFNLSKQIENEVPLLLDKTLDIENDLEMLRGRLSAVHRRQLVMLLFQLAVIDDGITNDEWNLLMHIMAKLNIESSTVNYFVRRFGPLRSSSYSDYQSSKDESQQTNNKPKTEEDVSSFFELLGLPADSSKQQVHQAYRKLAMEYHPDLPKNASRKEFCIKKMASLNVAFAKLNSLL